MFQHEFLPKADELLATTTDDGGRVYHSPVGDLRSVTTILGENVDKEWLDEWKKAVGEDEVKRVGGLATRHGTLVHHLAEQYLMNVLDPKKVMPNNRTLIKQLMPLLDENIDYVKAIEYPVWSKYLRTAGTIDLVCSWNKRLVIGDFKTSKQKLSLQDCIERGYFYQTTAYSVMLEERLGIRTLETVIINVPEFEPPCFYVQPRDKYLSEVFKIFTGKELK